MGFSDKVKQRFANEHLYLNGQISLEDLHEWNKTIDYLDKLKQTPTNGDSILNKVLERATNCGAYLIQYFGLSQLKPVEPSSDNTEDNTSKVKPPR